MKFRNCLEFLQKFCSMVVSNAQVSNPIRERFFRLLSEYKQVDSGGRLWNNVGGPVADKQKFISGCKFNIAFENSAVWIYNRKNHGCDLRGQSTQRVAFGSVSFCLLSKLFLCVFASLRSIFSQTNFVLL